MGRKSAAVFAFAALGIRAIIEWLTCLKSSSEVKKSWTAAQKSPPMTSQDFLKKNEEYPSSPGALSTKHRFLVLVKGGRQKGSYVNPTATPISALVKGNLQMRFQVDRATNIDFLVLVKGGRHKGSKNPLQ
jgi:hypothetical protein